MSSKRQSEDAQPAIQRQAPTLGAANDPAAGSTAGLGRLRPARTLRRQLVVRITLIVTAVAIALAALSTLLVGRIMINNLDQQLLYAIGATDDSPHGPRPEGRPGGRTGGPGSVLRVGGLPSGSISLIVTPNGNASATVLWEYGSTAASQNQINTLAALPGDGVVRAIHIEGLGDYRAVALSPEGSLLVVAAPLAMSQGIIMRMLWIELILTSAAAALAAGVSAVVVRASLRPLNRLAEIAGQVSALPLESGEVSLGVRVPDAQVDQSEVGRVGAAFNSMLDHVETSLRARHASETRVRRFVADASHELRNPLASIRGYSELTRRAPDQLPSDTVFALDRIESESLRMSRLVEQMLLLARLDTSPELAHDEIDLSATILNAMQDARAASPDHSWRWQLPDQPVIIHGDASQLHQAITNLLGNARKHTPAGTSVQTALTTTDGWAHIEVSDDGPGITDELKGRIFERFAKADSARAHDQEGSTGLGLAIVAAVVKAHGGSVAVSSQLATDDQPGHSRFTILMPTDAPHSPDPRAN